MQRRSDYGDKKMIFSGQYQNDSGFCKYLAISEKPEKIHEEPSVREGDLVTWKKKAKNSKFYFLDEQSVGIVISIYWSLTDWFVEERSKHFNNYYSPVATILWSNGEETNSSHSSLDVLMKAN